MFKMTYNFYPLLALHNPYQRKRKQIFLDFTPGHFFWTLRRKKASLKSHKSDTINSDDDKECEDRELY